MSVDTSAEVAVAPGFGESPFLLMPAILALLVMFFTQAIRRRLILDIILCSEHVVVAGVFCGQPIEQSANANLLPRLGVGVSYAVAAIERSC